MYKYIGSKRSKLKNFAPKILLCAERGVLSVRNANIVFGGTAEELGVWNFEFGIVRQGALRSVILQMSLQWVSDEYVSPRDTAQYKVTYYTALIDVLL